MDFAARFAGKVLRCEGIIGYAFKSKTLCGEALNAAGDHMSVYTLDGALSQMPKNTRLAVYGDAVAAAHLCGLWLDKSVHNQEWDVIRKATLANDNLARVGSDLGLCECIVLNNGTTTPSSKMTATAVEAILGAVHRDGGDASLAKVMGRLGLTQHALLSPVTLGRY
ncbi:uncharacterized protein DNG_01758 [Cephalotrichum gorgonifer]|uniref:RNase III domain-containing protein n=1 Tax=Cephalotrichum gorgonifer TaxID=2041049 RepID=A0AAE8MTQ4_9PEZI|nr:uncharacterized protein DNG_01758 [Cephalotrichum gorgonifer]